MAFSDCRYNGSPDDIEYLEEYDEDGYHPVTIGDTFREGRYEVVHKLGHGGYSTIWLVRDSRSGRYVALKILMACVSDDSEETKMLHLLYDGNQGQELPFTPKLLDEFSLEGPNGKHHCLVQELAGQDLAIARLTHLPMFPAEAEAARSMAAQLILNLAYVHSKGICHGDLQMRNFLLKGPNLDALNPDELYSQYPLQKISVWRQDGRCVEPDAPPYALYPMHIGLGPNQLTNPRVGIFDYGTSFFVETTFKDKVYCADHYAPPEHFFGEQITLAADIWTMGVSLYEILGNGHLFDIWIRDRDELLAEIIGTLGLPPAKWWQKWEKRDKFFDRTGKRIDEDDDDSRLLSQRVWEMGRGEMPETSEWYVAGGDGWKETPETSKWDVPGGEARDLENMLRSMLSWEPNDRPTTQEVLESDYMVKWAMPAWERQQQREKRSDTVRPGGQFDLSRWSQDLLSGDLATPSFPDAHELDHLTSLRANSVAAH